MYVYISIFFFFSSNLQKLDQLSSGLDKSLIPGFNFSDPESVTVEDYSAWFKQSGNRIPGNFTECNLEKEMQKVKIVCLLQCFFSVFGVLYITN